MAADQGTWREKHGLEGHLALTSLLEGGGKTEMVADGAGCFVLPAGSSNEYNLYIILYKCKLI